MEAVDTLHLLFRIAMGSVLGGVIGYERDLHGRPVGLRTHVLVSMAAATFMVVSAHFAYFQGYAPGDGIEVDASRIAASVVSGIGFLAGGAILRTGLNVRGLTTAAGLWLVTAIGLSAGAGMFAIAAAVTLMGMLALTVLRRLEDKDDAVTSHRVTLVALDLDVTETMKKLSELGVTVKSLDVERRRGEKPRTTLRFRAALPVRVPADRMLEVLEETPSVRRVHIEEAE